MNTSSAGCLCYGGNLTESRRLPCGTDQMQTGKRRLFTADKLLGATEESKAESKHGWKIIKEDR